MENPLITVLMPTYNSEKYLDDAISSILNQDFKDFEFLIINDASTDNSLEIIKRYEATDSRIKLINHEKNIGFLKNLNSGITMAKGKYIARMDSDDISHPNRFSKQLEILEKNDEIGIVGSWVKEIGSKMVFKYPLNHEQLDFHLLIGTPFGHPATMLRTSVLIENNIRYDESYKVAQDYELWSRLLKVTKGYNIPEELLEWRKHESSRSEKNKEERYKNTFKISNRVFWERFPNYSKENYFLENILLRKKEDKIETVSKAIEFINDITKDIDPFKEKYLFRKFSKKVYLYLRSNTNLGIEVFNILRRSKWNRTARKRLLSYGKFLFLSIKSSLRS